VPRVGDVLAERYRIDAVLGAGGMASVYRATDLRLDRQVAVKVLAANLAADAPVAERFGREAGSMASFSHPSVASVYDVEPGDPATGREPFYVMEYCDGGSLADRLKSGPLPPGELVPIIRVISDGLTELHRRGLVHRDVKPANVLFAGGRPKLADFGIARDAGGDADPLTEPGSTLGTLRFLAPEIVAGAPASPAGDVYALAVTTYVALNGRYPQPDAAAGMAGASSPDPGTGFDAALVRGLDPRPEARPTPADFADLLATGLAGAGVAAPNPNVIPSMPVEEDAPTRIAPPPPPATPAPVAPKVAEVVSPEVAPKEAADRPLGTAPPSRIGRFGPAIVVIAVFAVVAVLLVPRLLGGGSVVAPTPSPSVAVVPSAVLPSADGAVATALDAVDAAIEAARGGKDGLSGKDANELAELTASVRAAVDRGDLAAARSAAATLSGRAVAVTKDLDKARRDVLLAAIGSLSQALAL
jgi:hypothetical protein